ncbi:MAG: YraN family protein [Clostridia bacterium]|nr:YraN family protein [Lachnospiraceae bacterium]NCC01938.1 YraN family protein [Clostridia bacterium]NCD03933.1 YraN family protein [Clostridia bacterium]
MINKRKLGASYEDSAAEYLICNGYRIIERNYRISCGEIDIIAQKDSILVFFEIKFRRNEACGGPLEAVDLRKQRKICKTALYYYSTHGYSENIQCRFDVIGIYGNESIHHIENAFDFI